MAKVLVFTATYNEIDNVENFILEVSRYLPGQDILIVDDNSPDGTGTLLDRLRKNNKHLNVVHRPDKLGLGTAHILAIKYALIHDYDYLITMDADFSHHPKYLPELFKSLKENDFVIGSRYIKGGHCDYGFIRTVVSKTANYMARILLGIPTYETTTSFRGFSKNLLEKIKIDNIKSDGYSFFMECMYFVKKDTNKIKEFPIYFEDRRAGSSKISKREIIKAIYRLFRLAFKRLMIYPYKKPTQPYKPIAKIIPCENCHSLFQLELYPRKESTENDSKVYQCTSMGHGVHGQIIKCLECGLIFNETRHNPKDILDLYKEVEDESYIQNIEARFQTFRHNFKKIEKYLPSKGRHLDVGSYCGVSLKVAKEFGLNSLGLEPSKWASKYACEVMEENTIQGTIYDLPVETGSFDVISMWDVLEHLVHPIDDLNQIHSRLNPNGIFLFSTICIDRWYPRILKDKWPWIMDMHLYYFTQKSIKQILQKTGFDLIHQQNYTHIITLAYFFEKLSALGIPLAKQLHRLISKTFLKNCMIPFSFGDVQLFVCKKTSTLSPEITEKPQLTSLALTNE